MKKNFERMIFTLVFMIMCFALCGCTKASKEIILDYGDAEAFEAALVNGENLEGKTVQFVADELHPQSIKGYNIWAGEHLNFISKRNPGIKAGDTVCVIANTIESETGSWFIYYDKIDNAVIGATTICANSIGAKDLDELEKNAESAAEIPVEKTIENYAADAEDIVDEYIEDDDTSAGSESMIEFVNADIVVFNDYFGEPNVSAYSSFVNMSNQAIRIEDARIEYQDKDGKLLLVDDMIECIPEVILPGQTGYIYSYHQDLTGVDLSNGLISIPDGQVVAARNPYVIDISDLSVKTTQYQDVEVIARGTNNTDREHSFAKIGAVFFDKDNNVVGFCYGFEGFQAGQSKAFEISGDLMSRDYNPGIVDRVEVYAQGYELF